MDSPNSTRRNSKPDSNPNSSRTATLHKLWVGALALAVVLLLGAAWLASGNPQLSGEAEALSLARTLMPNLEKRAHGFQQELARGQGGIPSIQAFRFNDSGELIEPLRLPNARELRDEWAEQIEGIVSPAAAWWRSARASVLVKDWQNAQLQVEEGLKAAEASESAMRMRLRFTQVQVLMRTDGFEQAEEILRGIYDESPEITLDGYPVRLNAGLRLLHVYRQFERASETLQEELWQDLLQGRFPLEVDQLRFEAMDLWQSLFVAAEQDAPALEAYAQMQEALRRFQLAQRLGDIFAQNPEVAVIPLERDTWAVRNESRAIGQVYAEEDLKSAYGKILNAELSPNSGFAVLFPKETSSDPNLGSFDVMPGFARCRLVLVDSQRFEEPAAQRRFFIWSVSLLLAAFLGGLGWLGHKALKRQEELEKLRSEFVAGVSHDLRTPAASLELLVTNLAEGRVRNEARRLEYYQAMRRDAVRLQRLVADALDFTRMDQGSIPLELDICYCPDLLEELVTEFRPRLEEVGLKLRFDSEKSPKQIYLDREAVVRAVANLLENARKYATGGKEVWLRAEVCSAPRSSGFEIHVLDDGPGIDQALQEKVFKPFERGRQSDQRSVAGAGLGLALVRTTMEAHGGAVRVRNRPQGGACFTLSFPQNCLIAEETG